MTKRKKSVLMLGSLGMAALLCVGIGFGVVNARQYELADELGNAEYSDGGMELDASGSTGSAVALTSETIPVSMYEEYGISPAAETAVQVKGTISRTDGGSTEGLKLDWSLVWKDASSSWARGKDASDYVSLSVSDDTFTATLGCLDAFGESLQLTAALQGDAKTKSSACAVEYIQRYRDMSASIAYTNSSKPAANVTWTITKPSSGQLVVPFPPYGLTFSEFEDYYSASGAHKGTYAVTVNTGLSDVYTKAAQVTDVKMSFSSSQTYITQITLYNGVITRGAGQVHLESTLGSGAKATVSGVDFDRVLAITSTGNFDWLGFRNSRGKGSSGAPSMGTITLECKVNGEAHSVAITYCFDGSALVSSAGVSIDRESIDF